MNIKMLNGFILVKVLERNNVSSGGIIQVTSTTQREYYGEVISAGAGKYFENGTREDHGISTGDIVIFGESALNRPFDIDDKGETDLFVMTSDDIYGKKVQ